MDDATRPGETPGLIGFTSSGRPVWAIAGAAEDDGAGDDDKGGSEDDGAGDDDKGGSDDKGGEDVSGLKTALDKERKARREAEKNQRDTANRLKKLEDAGKSDDEQRTARLAELEANSTRAESELREARITLALTTAALDANAKRPAEVARLVDRSDLDLDDEGRVTNADEAISKAKQRVPELFRGGKPTGDADGGARGSASDGGKPDMEKILRRAAGH